MCAEFGKLGLGLLNAIFPENTLIGAQSFLDTFGRMKFADGYEFDRSRVATAVLGGR